MTLLRKLLLALFCVGLVTAPLVIAPQPADARAGWTSRGPSSMGSMGSQTYRYNGGSPIGRSTTPYANPGYRGGYGGYGGYGYGGYHPFWSGLAGGLFGGWLGSMMFPHWGMGYGGYGYGGGMGWGGGFLSIIIWLGLIYLGYRLFRGLVHGAWGFGYGSGPGVGMSYGGSPWGGGVVTPAPGAIGYGPGPVVDQIPISQSDQTAFEAVLKAVQGAWGKADLSTLRHYVTPEMLAYFNEQLAENQSQGVENHVEDVEFIDGDVHEAWNEGALEYATVVMRWRARDWVARTDKREGEPGWLADGDPKNATEAREMWTFARSPSGHWLLSAIQQV